MKENKDGTAAIVDLSSLNPNLVFMGQYSDAGAPKMFDDSGNKLTLTFYVIYIKESDEGMEGFWRTTGSNNFKGYSWEKALDNTGVEWVPCDHNNNYKELV